MELKLILRDVTLNNFFIDVSDLTTNEIIGNVVLFKDNNEYWLNKITVYDENNNVGKCVVKKLNEEYSPFKISLSDKVAHNDNSSNKNIDDTRYVNRSGLYLLQSCFEKGVLQKSNFAFPFEIKSGIYLREFNFLDNYFSCLQNIFNRINRLDVCKHNKKS